MQEVATTVLRLLVYPGNTNLNNLNPPSERDIGYIELTLKCKLKRYVKPMKDPLGVSPSKGNQGTTRGKEKFF